MAGRYSGKLTNCLTGEKNRAQNCLTVSILKLDDVFSDVFGKSARSITEHNLNHPGESFDVTPFIDRRCKHPASEIQAVKLREGLNHIDELETHRARIESEILNLTERYALVLNLLRTVPGFSANPHDCNLDHCGNRRGYVRVSNGKASLLVGWLLSP